MSKTLIKDSVPAFLAKLWKLLNDENTDSIIHWNKDGTTFIVKDQAKFSTNILPKYFKHGNFASFVRQLNMYDFHKVFSVERGGLNGRDYWEFSNKNFQRDYPEKLEMVKRKVSQSALKLEQNKIKSEDISVALSEISVVKNEQENINSKFAQMKMENEMLWNEIITLRKKHQMQQQIVNKLVQFLVSCMYKEKGLPIRKKRLMLENAPAPSKIRKVGDNGNGSHDVEDSSSGYYVNFPNPQENNDEQQDQNTLQELKNGAVVCPKNNINIEKGRKSDFQPYDNPTVYDNNQSALHEMDATLQTGPVLNPDDGFDLDAVLGEGNSSIVPVTDSQNIPSVIPLELESPTLNPDTAYIGERVDNVQDSLDQLHSLLASRDSTVYNVFSPQNLSDNPLFTNEQEEDFEELLRSFTGTTDAPNEY